MLIIFFSCEKDEASVGSNHIDQTVNMSSREKALADFEEFYVKTEVDDLGWTGSIADCNQGTVDVSVGEKMKTRLNYLRRLVGVREIELNTETEYANQAQAAAALMNANWTVTHNPNPNFICYSEAGQIGAKKSQLTININNGHSVNGMMNLMRDLGNHNKKVGHRRWMIHSQANSFSFGSAEITCAIMMHRDKYFSPSSKTIAYPGGYFPEKLVFERWSFGLPGADFQNAEVKMTGPDGEVSLDVIFRYKYLDGTTGDNSIVWEPSIDLDVSGDKKYTVTISGVQKAEKTTYTYDVIIIDQD